MAHGDDDEPAWRHGHETAREASHMAPDGGSPIPPIPISGRLGTTPLVHLVPASKMAPKPAVWNAEHARGRCNGTVQGGAKGGSCVVAPTRVRDVHWVSMGQCVRAHIRRCACAAAVVCTHVGPIMHIPFMHKAFRMCSDLRCKLLQRGEQCRGPNERGTKQCICLHSRKAAGS